MYLDDPNDPLKKGGNIEHLSIPIQKMPNRVELSVNCLRFDREVLMQKTAVVTVKKTATKKRKVGNA